MFLLISLKLLAEILGDVWSFLFTYIWWLIKWNLYIDKDKTWCSLIDILAAVRQLELEFYLGYPCNEFFHWMHMQITKVKPILIGEQYQKDKNTYGTEYKFCPINNWDGISGVFKQKNSSFMPRIH